ncbi:hypothetical protein EYF80_028647 [Liparis tanakae]|uniref:Uncharacterized protein n=1 Tax=Liparis tanakae TaxID=230148 RepID=A0A4Z2H5Q8_9TELE|nr:hypothetical protein EYF80_028647 [Liparis tanakae]
MEAGRLAPQCRPKTRPAHGTTGRPEVTEVSDADSETVSKCCTNTDHVDVDKLRGQKEGCCTLTVGLKGQLEAAALDGGIRCKVDEEVVVSSLEDRRYAGTTETVPECRSRTVWTIPELRKQNKHEPTDRQREKTKCSLLSCIQFRSLGSGRDSGR